MVKAKPNAAKVTPAEGRKDAPETPKKRTKRGKLAKQEAHAASQPGAKPKLQFSHPAVKRLCQSVLKEVAPGSFKNNKRLLTAEAYEALHHAAEDYFNDAFQLSCKFTNLRKAGTLISDDFKAAISELGLSFDHNNCHDSLDSLFREAAGKSHAAGLSQADTEQV
jgi:histone H3/H4